jgi:CheY-like chemotaxis protein
LGDSQGPFAGLTIKKPVSNGTRDTGSSKESGREAAARLQAQKIEVLGQLASSVAHEFNNFLAAITMQVGIIQDCKSLPEEAVGQLKSLEKLAEQASAVTAKLLLFSRRRESESQLLDLNVAVREICKVIVRLMGKDVRIEVRTSPEALWIEADPGMIEQVVMNLCINARDAMPHGGHLTVDTRVDRKEGGAAFACLGVRDTGCGMSAETRARIFEPFYTTKPSGKGTGLGLAAVDEILKQHGGRVEVESELGHGSTFRVYFPAGDAGGLVQSVIPAQTTGPGHGESILVVEDDPTICRMMVAVLKRSGYRVVSAASAADALRRWDHEHEAFDVLLTDFLLPGGMNGFELCERLSRAKPRLRMIVMSGFSIGSREADARSGLRIVQLAKPFQMQALLSTVRQCLDTA